MYKEKYTIPKEFHDRKITEQIEKIVEKEKKIDIENQTFYSRKFVSMQELNEHWAPNKEIIKCLINHMYEEFKIFLDNEFDLDKKYYTDDLTIENRIRFIPNTIFRNKINKKK